MDHERLSRIDEAFAGGDMTALRTAVGDPPDFPNNAMPLGVGPILTYAIYWSPLRFIEALPGSKPRSDVVDVMARLLDAGADPNQRGLNDWTALHMAVHETNVEAVRLLLARGADRELRTRIDDCDTPLEMARAGVVRQPAARAELEAIIMLLDHG